MPRPHRLPFTPPWGFEPAARALVEAALGRGEVIGYPTDTFYGLGADPHNTDAIARIFAVKGRSAGEPIPLIASGVEPIERWCGALVSVAARLADDFWPGPLTLVLPIVPDAFPDALTAGRTSIAVRVPAHAAARDVALAAGGLITSTSANRSGEPPASTAGEVVRLLGDALALVVDAGPSSGGAPSTIVDLTNEEPRLLRAGAVPWDRVLESLQR